MRQKRREWDRFLSEAEKVARKAAPTVIRAGMAVTPAGAAFKAAAPLVLAQRQPSEPSQPAARRRRAAATPAPRKSPAPWLDQFNQNPFVIDAAGHFTREFVRPAGAVQSIKKSVEGLVELAPVAAALHPLAPGFIRDRGMQQGADLVLDAYRAAGDYAKSRLAEPSRIREDVERGFQDFRVRTDPTATPEADTALGEIVRNIPIGLHQGEFAFDVLSAVYGGAEIKGLLQLNRLGKMSRAERLAVHGREKLSPEGVESFASPYTGEGHHFVGKRIFKSEKIPEPVRKLLKEHFMDSKWNVLKPKGFDKGQFYKRHHLVDLHVEGGPHPKWVPEKGWSAKKLGWEKAGSFGRFWHGRPTALRKLGVNLVGAGLAGDLGGLLLVDDPEALSGAQRATASRRAQNDPHQHP